MSLKQLLSLVKIYLEGLQVFSQKNQEEVGARLQEEEDQGENVHADEREEAKGSDGKREDDDNRREKSLTRDKHNYS